MILRRLEMHRNHHHLRIVFLVLAYGSITAGQPAATFSASGSMITLRFGHTATLLTDGKVLVAGGYGGMPSHAVDDRSTVLLASAELYDPARGASAVLLTFVH